MDVPHLRWPVKITPVDRFWTAPAAPAPRARSAEALASAQAARTAPTTAPRAAMTLVPVDAPADTDAQLWSVLTSPERTFFSRSAPRNVTYGPSGAAGSMGARGQALDVRA